jgi:hypothetical protein
MAEFWKQQSPATKQTYYFWIPRLLDEPVAVGDDVVVTLQDNPTPSLGTLKRTENGWILVGQPDPVFPTAVDAADALYDLEVSADLPEHIRASLKTKLHPFEAAGWRISFGRPEGLLRRVAVRMTAPNKQHFHTVLDEDDELPAAVERFLREQAR